MIRHIIMFKFSEIKNESDKKEKSLEMQKAFYPLKDKIDIIQRYDVAINQKKTDFSYDVIIISEFNSWQDLTEYIEHPAHQEAIIKCQHIKKEKAVVDYEF